MSSSSPPTPEGKIIYINVGGGEYKKTGCLLDLISSRIGCFFLILTWVIKTERLRKIGWEEFEDFDFVRMLHSCKILQAKDLKCTCWSNITVPNILKNSFLFCYDHVS